MSITSLSLRERVSLDREPIEEMCHALGPERAEALVGSAMEELAVWLNRAEKLVRAGNRTELARIARLSAAVARRLGMPLLARIALETADLAVNGDDATLTAVAARMTRVGESSLVAVWELQGVTV